MKKILIMLFLPLFALPLHGQKYTKVLNHKLSSDDLRYMPKSELKILKSELTTNKESVFKEDNLTLVTETKGIQNDKDNIYTDQELLEKFLTAVDQKERIPLYLQVRFLERCQNPEANIFELSVSKAFTTIVISEPTPMVGPQGHRIVTFRENGDQIDVKHLQGKAEFKDNKVIHESYNSLIEYVYTIDEEGHFDKETPTKRGN